MEVVWFQGHICVRFWQSLLGPIMTTVSTAPFWFLALFVDSFATGWYWCSRVFRVFWKRFIWPIYSVLKSYKDFERSYHINFYVWSKYWSNSVNCKANRRHIISLTVKSCPAVLLLDVIIDQKRDLGYFGFLQSGRNLDLKDSARCDS